MLRAACTLLFTAVTGELFSQKSSYGLGPWLEVLLNYVVSLVGVFSSCGVLSFIPEAAWF